MKLTLLNLFLLFVGAINAQNNIDPTFGVKELTADVEYFFTTLEEAHPNLYYYHTKDSVFRVKESIMRQLVSPMSRDNFNRLMELNTNHLFDGHTGLKRYFERRTTIPDSALLFPSNLISVEQGSIYFNENSKRFKILSINGLHSSKLISTMRSLIGDDQITYIKDCTIEDYFSTYFFHLYGSNNFYNLIIEHDGDQRQLTLQGVLKKDLYTEDEIVPFALNIQDDIALITVNSFGLRYFKEFQVFLNNSIKQIRQANVKYLFIDISENSGGSSDNVNLLLDYLYPVDYCFLSGYATIRYSERHLEDRRETFFIRYEDKEEAEKKYNLWKKSIESEYETGGGEWERIYNVDSPYLSKLFVLQSYKTFSASLDVSSAIKSSNRGLLIGEPTSDPAYNFSQAIGLEMPNTKIRFMCATGFYAMPSGSHNSKIGILPDVYCHHKDLRAMKKDTDLLFNYFKSIITKYGDRQNAIEILKMFW